ncbi:MAG: alpha/beta hydrolase [Gammaproteobacteria bacterium]|jgi:pimeloyl-ACP methyl ester carboxylesterase|nr:alpha/beta hydrolase [Gammaproteobacteria bacterium]
MQTEDVSGPAEGRLRGETVVLVHGLWMAGLELLPLARRLRADGFRCVLHRYPSTRQPSRENAERLADRLASLGPGRVHVVAHSYGGLVTLRALGLGRGLPPGRVVLLGVPVNGSAPARRLAAHPWLRRPFGHSLQGGLIDGAGGATGGREVGVVAGSLPLGLGGLVAGFDEPHDGTVAVSETRLDAATDRLVARVSHFGLLFSPRVAEAVARFLRTGRLRADPASAGSG